MAWDDSGNVIWYDNLDPFFGWKSAESLETFPASISGFRSNAIYKGLDLVCEGEIQGLVNGDKSIYLDGVPLQNDDNTYNFENVVTYSRLGLNNQEYIPDFNQVETPVTSGMPVELTYAPGNPTYVTKTITDSNVEAVRLNIGLGGLYKIKNNGDFKSYTVGVSVDVQCDHGGYVNVINGAVAGSPLYFHGQTTAAYERSVTIQLSTLGNAPYDIRVYRANVYGEGDFNIISSTFLNGYTEIIYLRMTYPYSAVFGLQCDARSMGGKIPSRLYHIRGRKIKVPKNYTPYLTATYVDGDTFTVTGDQRSIFTAGTSFCCNCGDDGYKNCTVYTSTYSTVTVVNLTASSDDLTSNLVSAERIYTGTWDGTFSPVKKWSSNSAWVYYDVLNDPLACAGINAGYIDKWTLYNIGRYCDVLVDDGFGKKEPRFSFNGKIDSVYDAQELFYVLAASFNSMPYWGTAIATISQDRPTDATRTYTNANVIDGDFFYGGTGLREIDPDGNYVWNGTVGGDLNGDLETVLLGFSASSKILNVEFDWIVSAGENSFTARMSGILDTETGKVVMNGTIIDGWLKGAQVHEEGQLVDLDSSGFAGTIRIMPASAD